jgi:hypothetical protein
VDSRKREKTLLREMKPWLDKGYMPQSVTESNAYLVQQLKIKWWYLLLWTLIIPVIGGAFYILYVYSGELQTLFITVGTDGKVWVQKSQTR